METATCRALPSKLAEETLWDVNGLSCGDSADALEARRLLEHRDQTGSLVERPTLGVAHLREYLPLACGLDQAA